MWVYNYSTELYHHGIKGMQWGRRRFQDKNGDLTKAGKARYADDGQKKPNVFSKRKDKLISKYKEKGYGDSAAEVAAKNQMKTEIILGSLAAVAVAVVATKVVTRVGQDYFDKTIKAGKVIQNIGPSGDRTFKDAPFFAAVNKSDKRTYGMNYAFEKRQLLGNDYKGIHKSQIKLVGDVKQASVKNAKKIFFDKLDNDKEFKNQVVDAMRKTNYTKGLEDFAKSGKKTSAFYDSFNRALATPAVQESGVHNKYYSALKGKGYNAILDINDTRYSGYKKVAKSPTIFFGGDKWEKIGSEKISDIDIDNNAKKFTNDYITKQSLKSIAVLAGAITGITQASKNNAIKTYLDQHPNSKLSDKEILERSGY